MIKVYWDKSLKPDTRSEEDKELARWDEWFEACGLKEEWQQIKQACADTNQTKEEIIGWARITELTRLGNLAKDEAATKS